MSETPVWIRSSYSDSSGGECVEWAPALASAGSVPVRDSKNPSLAPLRFSPDAWSAFVAGLREADK
ncbi:DUF397 domain-containing protein [Streptomyces boncukensis]|uniref:DUF397 domain-containing protein n=1 Tax=Streptomyces boncukensis TaxID=2711219 RepID=A0A6G4WQZ8_9ACTN|nr:DUF397 domain-containing protein [Streptomyces boncukensis]NGO67443.1 DUF397 domain-containing protein [Streptomyces boncukensis]